MKDIKLVLSDLDGTLLTDEKKASNKTIEMIGKLRQKGIKFGIATGRAKQALDKLLPIYGIEDLVDVLIYMNGSIVTLNDATNEYYPLENKDVMDIYEYSKKFDKISFSVYDDKEFIMYCDKPNEAINQVAKNNLFTVKQVNMDEFLNGKSFLKCMYVGNNDDLNAIYDDVRKLETDKIKYVKSGPRMYEIFDSHLSKSFGINKVCESLNITIDNVMTLGDSENDIEMIKDAGVGVCMKNGYDSIKKIADFVTKDDNNHDGLANFLQEYFSL